MSAHTPGPWKVHDLYPHVIVTEKDKMNSSTKEDRLF